MKKIICMLALALAVLNGYAQQTDSVYSMLVDNSDLQTVSPDSDMYLVGFMLVTAQAYYLEKMTPNLLTVISC